MAAETEIERMVVRLVGDSTTFKSMMREAAGLTRSLGQNMTQLGRTMTTRVTLPLVALGGVAVKAFSDFDQAMTESTSIMSTTADQVERMRDLSLSLAGEATQGPEELARSYFFLASAGKDAEQSMALLPKVAKFATAGAFDMALATDLLTDAQSALGLSVKDVSQDMKNMTRLSDVLVKANTLANASVQQFSEALTNDAGATMRSFNIEVEEGVAVLAAFADQGIKGNHAGSSFGRMLRLMTTGARENKEAFQELNIQVFNAEGNLRNMADIIGDIEVAFKDMSTEAKGAALEQLGFNALAQKAILPLLGTSDAIRKYQTGLEEAKGITEEVADKQMQSFANQMKLLKNQITAVAIEIGETLAPTVQRIGEFVKDLVERWKGLSEEQRLTILRFGAIVAAAGPALLVMGNMIKLLGLLRIALIKTGIGAIAVALGVLTAQFLGTKEGVAELNKILEPFKGLWDQLKSLWKELEPIVVSLAKALGGALLVALQNLAPIVAKVLETLVGIGSAIANAINKALKASEASKEIETIRDKIRDMRADTELQDLIDAMPDDPDPRQNRKIQLFTRRFRAISEGSPFNPEAVDENLLSEMTRINFEAGQLARERKEVESKELKELQTQREQVQDGLIKGLEKQIATYGKTRREIALYEAAQLNATKAQRESINALFDQIEGLEAQEKAKEDAKQATEDAREATEKARQAEERFQNSIRGFGIEGVGRGIEALARIEESRNLRGEGFNTAEQALNNLNKQGAAGIAQASSELLGAVLTERHGTPKMVPKAPANLEQRLAKSQAAQEKLLMEEQELMKQIAENTRITAGKDPIEVQPANIGG